VRLENVPVAYVRYLGKAFWPSRLAVLYPHPGRFLADWKVLASTLLLLSLTTLVLYFRNRRYAVVGWFWFLGTLVPVIGLVQVGVQAMADRYAYLPYIGLFVGVVWCVAEIAQERKIPSLWFGVPIGLLLLTLGMITRQQLAYWHDTETLWRQALSVTEGNYAAHNALATELTKQGRMDEATAEFNETYKLNGYSVSEIIEIGVIEQNHGRPQDAIVQYERALQLSADAKSRSVALAMLGSAFEQAGDIDHERMSYQYALREDPDNGVALVSSGLLAEQDGDLTAAVAQIAHAMKVGPTDVGYLLLEQALRRAGRPTEANDAHMRAQKMSRDFAKAQGSARGVLAAAGIKGD
jgi:Tfp pilus assembly protein PilF